MAPARLVPTALFILRHRSDGLHLRADGNRSVDDLPGRFVPQTFENAEAFSAVGVWKLTVDKHTFYVR